MIKRPIASVEWWLRPITDHGRPVRAAYVIDERGCWIWQGTIAVKPCGYAHAMRNTPERKPCNVAREVAYCVAGPSPSELVADHKCREPRCVNPAHIELVTQAQNVRRGRATKLTPGDIEQIRLRSAAGATGPELARAYRISTRHVSAIVRHENWKEAAT